MTFTQKVETLRNRLIDKLIERNINPNRVDAMLDHQQGVASVLRRRKSPEYLIDAGLYHGLAGQSTGTVKGGEIAPIFTDKELKDIIGELNSWEYYKGKLAQPVIRVGASSDYAGKIEVLMAGGTNGGSDVFKAYFEAGVGTIIAMHLPEDVKKAVIEQNIGNVIIAPHMPSDSIGLLEIVKAWRKEGVEVTTMSGIVES